jgi:hypothetical protein
MTEEHEQLREIAKRLFVGRSVLDETKARKTLGLAEIYSFLTDPGRSFSQEQQRALFLDRNLLMAYREIKADLKHVEMPSLAAAGDAALDTRSFAGGNVRVAPSRLQGQTYVIMRFNWPSGPPRAIVLEGKNGEFQKRALPKPDADGELLMVLTQSVPADQMFLRLLADPTASGSFIL